MVHSRSYAPFAFACGRRLSAASSGSSAASIAALVARAASPTASSSPSLGVVDIRRELSAASLASFAAAAAAASFLGAYRRLRTTPSAMSCSLAVRSSLHSRLRSPTSQRATSAEGESAAATQSNSSWHNTDGLR